MSVEERGITCDECGIELDPATPKGAPCPACGCKIQRVHVEVSERIVISTKERMRVRIKDEKGWSQEHLQGDDLHRMTGKWMYKERMINKKKDRYREVVTDPKTGQVVYSCDEPLSEHKGHGSARSSETELPGSSKGEL